MAETFIVAILGPIAMYFCLREKTAAIVRKSMFWPLAVIVYLNICGYTVQSWFKVIDYLGIELPPEEVGMPLFFIAMFAIAAILFYFNAYRPYRQAVKEARE